MHPEITPSSNFYQTRYTTIVAGVILWIRQASAPKFGDVIVNPDTRLLDKQLLDSLQIMDLVFHLEETFSNSIALDELTAENFETPAAIAAMVARAVGAREVSK